MVLKKSLLAATLACSAMSSHAFFGTNYDLGTLTPTPTGAFSFVGVGVLGMNILGGNSFTFDLNTKTNVYLDIYTAVGVSLFGDFDLFSANGTKLSSKSLASAADVGLLNADALGFASVGLLSHRRITFSDINAADNYKVSFDPGLVSLGVFNKVTFSATNAAPAIPEPSTWALMGLGLAGLGVVALRRRRAQETATA